MDPTRRLPDALVQRARAFAHGGRAPVTPKDASTVVLLRDGTGPGGVEVYLLRRSIGMAFAGGFWVFPGGGVDPRDFGHEVGWVGPSAQEWGSLLGTAPAQARALVCAALRETFEESGVLLAGPTPDTVVEDTTGTDWEADRRRLEARELSFTDFLEQRGLRLRTDLLSWWGSWVTPVFEPKRYDTRFFVARLPPGQVTRDVSSESDEVRWMPVSAVVDAVNSGEMAMLPPTYATCLELDGLRTPEDVVAAAATRDRSPVLPEMQIDGEGGYLRLPTRFQSLDDRAAARRAARR